MKIVLKFILGALLAALASFTWGYLSWEVLGWHKNNTFGFSNESDVSEVLLKNIASGHGVYMLPHQGEVPSFLPPDEKARKAAALRKARDTGPFLRAIIRPGKKPFDLKQAMAFSYGRSLVACLILGGLLVTSSFPYVGKVVFCAAVGVFAGVAGETPDWIWFELRGADLFVAIADHLFEWTAAGAVLAAFVGKPQTIEN